MTTKKIVPFEATHPGTLIKDELDVRNDITQKDLATLLGVKPSFLNEIIKGKRPITADIAILLEKTLDISADYWMKFQSQYEIDLARIKEKNIKKTQMIEVWKMITHYVPIKYFNKKGYLTGDISSNISIIQSIYSIESTADLAQHFQVRKFAFFKKSENLQIDEKNMVAWTSLVEYEANRKETDPFYFDKLSELYKELQEIFYNNNNTIELVDKKLAQYGIKFILADKLEKTPIDGYSFWSNANPAMALTLRHNRIDNFAFTVLHELGHIVLHLRNNKDLKFIDLTNIDENDYENEANTFAQEKLIPGNYWNDLRENDTPLSDAIIYEFAKKYRINPAIIVGRACFEMNDYERKTTIDRKIK